MNYIIASGVFTQYISKTQPVKSLFHNSSQNFYLKSFTYMYDLFTNLCLQLTQIFQIQNNHYRKDILNI